MRLSPVLELLGPLRRDRRDPDGRPGKVRARLVLFGEPVTAIRVACIGLIIAGIMGLKAAAA